MRRFYPLILLLLGVVIAAASFGWTAWTWNSEMAAGFGVSSPATIDLDLGPDAGEHALWRELEGTHVTTNRPLLDPPDDLAVVITDRRSGETVPWHDYSGFRTRQQLMPGFVRHRRGLLVFMPPDHGEISIAISGSFEYDQPYRVSPSLRDWISRFQRYGWVGMVIGGSLVVVALGLVVVRLVRAEVSAEATAGR